MNHRTALILTLLFIAGFILVTVPVSADTGSTGNTLTRGGRFSITITGTPNTPYYFWLARTYSMSGKPGDQPPVIQASQLNVEQDPAGGPYTIGSYAYYNGNGRTILEDVASSTPEMPNTSYYGRVTTDTKGQAIVLFRTSSATAARSFSVKAENPNAPSDSNTRVEETVYSRTTPPTLRTTTPIATLTVPPTPEPTVVITIPITTAPPSTPAIPPTRANLTTAIALVAIIAGLVAVSRKY